LADVVVVETVETAGAVGVETVSAAIVVAVAVEAVAVVEAVLEMRRRPGFPSPSSVAW